MINIECVHIRSMIIITQIIRIIFVIVCIIPVFFIIKRKHGANFQDIEWLICQFSEKGVYPVLIHTHDFIITGIFNMPCCGI